MRHNDSTTRVRYPAAVAAAVLFAGVSSPTFAVNLGTYGTSYEIAEPDIRAVIAEQIGNVDGDSINRQARDRVEHFGENLSPNSRPTIVATKTVAFDVTESVSRDVIAPVRQPDGSMKDQVIVKKGTKVNPLRTLQPATALFFVDPRVETQKMFLDQVLAYDPASIKPVVIAGDPTRLTKERGSPVFYAQPWMLEKLRITNVPALVRAGTGDQAGLLVVTYFDSKMSVDELRTVWKPKLSGANSAGNITAPIRQLSAQERQQNEPQGEKK